AESFAYEQMLPAPGQGALAVQVRTDDAETVSTVLVVDHAETRVAVTAERAFERRLGGGWHTAIAAVGAVSDEPLRLSGPRGAPSGGRLFRGEPDGTIDDPAWVGLALAERLMDAGGAELLEAMA